VTQSRLAQSPATSGTIPLWAAALIAAALTIAFVALLFPWDAVARRLAFEIGAASGARIEIGTLAPAWTRRGPVLRANDVRIEHPSVEALRVDPLEIAPRFSTSWLSGRPRLRIYADSPLGRIDGVLVLGAEPSFDGRVERVAIERLPLRIESAGVRVAGELAAVAEVALDPGGTLRGRVDFDSPTLQIDAALIPVPLRFSRATGTLSLLESGATRIESVALDGDQLRAKLEGEIGLVHHSQPPPLALDADVEIVDPELRALAQAARLPIGPDGRAALRIGGTAALPTLTPRSTP
jgi:type II secretion system protein N